MILDDGGVWKIAGQIFINNSACQIVTYKRYNNQHEVEAHMRETKSLIIMLFMKFCRRLLLI